MNPEKEQRNYFYRLLFCGVCGVFFAHLLHFSSSVYIAIYPLTIISGMPRFSMKGFLGKVLNLLIAFGGGLIVLETFNPVLIAILVYVVFISALKLFSYNNRNSGTVYAFCMTLSMATILGSYSSLSFENAAIGYISQMFWVFIILVTAFVLFPSNMTSPPISVKEKASLTNKEVLLYGFILWGAWLLYMFFDLKSSFFAYVSIISLFMNFNLKTAKKKALMCIKAHAGACISTSIFSLILFSMDHNIFLLLFGLILLFIPPLTKAVYSEDPGDKAFYLTLVNGLVIPMTLYLSTDGSALRNSMMRLLYISIFMFFMLIVFSLDSKLKISRGGSHES